MFSDAEPKFLTQKTLALYIFTISIFDNMKEIIFSDKPEMMRQKNGKRNPTERHNKSKSI